MGIFTSNNNNNYFSSYIDIKAISTPSNPNSGIGRIFHRSSDGKLCFKLSNGTVIELSGGGGSGEVNTYSNAGAGGVGIILTKSGVDFPFKAIAAGSTKVTVTDDTDNKTVDIDVDESALDLANIGGTATWTQVSKTGSVLNDIADVVEDSPAQYDVIQRDGSSQWVGAKITNDNIDDAAAITTSKLADSATLLTTTNTKTVTGKTILDSGTGNQIGVHVPYTFTIYQTASNYIVRNNHTGALQSFSNSDFSPVLEWAIDNVVNVTGGITDSSVTGGAIFIQRGIYTATTNLAVDIDTATRHGITVEGEGLGTQIYFNPDSGSPLTDGITVDMMGFGLRHMRIRANEYVTNIIHHTGHASGRKNSHYKYEYLMIEGPNGDAGNSGAPTNISGQKGIFIDGTNLASYHGTVHGCEFIALETGLDLYDNQATSCKVTNDVFWCCEYSIIIEEGSGQNMINNIWIQGQTDVGTTGIWIKGNGQNTVISNVVTELQRENPPATEIACRAILLDTGVQDTYIVNVNNVFEGIHSLAKTIEDNSGNFTNSHQSHLNVGDTNFMRFDKTNSVIRFNTSMSTAFANAQIRITDSDGGASYIITGGNITGTTSRNVTIPAISANSNFVLDDTTQTLTNKTLTSPIISTISNTGTVTLPTATTTLVGRDTTDTLTNKTISGGSNTISNVPDSALTSNVALKNTSNVFTEPQKISDTAETVFTAHRTSNTTNDRVSFDLSLNNSDSEEKVYTSIRAGNITPTAGAENAQLEFYTLGNGTLARRFLVNAAGNCFIGNNARLMLGESGLTGSRQYSFADVNGQIPVRERLTVAEVAGASAFTPSAGFVTIFFNTDDSKLSIKNSGGTVTPLH